MARNKVLILNGPNLNLLGSREVDIYGSTTLAQIEEQCTKRAERLNLAIEFRQSNNEGSLIDYIQAVTGKNTSGMIINAAAYTHTSVALADAIMAIDIPVIEIHISNVYAREEFRSRSFIAPIAAGLICGFGANTYLLALDAMHGLLETSSDR